MNTKHTAGNWEICAETETQIFIASTKAGARSEQGKGSYICQNNGGANEARGRC
jgi:hypothetical protein